MQEQEYSRPNSFIEFFSSLPEDRQLLVGNILISDPYCVCIRKQNLEFEFIILILNSNWKNPSLAQFKQNLEQTLLENLNLKYRNREAQQNIATRLRQLIENIRAQAGLSGDGSFYQSRPKGSRGSIFPEGI